MGLTENSWRRGLVSRPSTAEKERAYQPRPEVGRVTRLGEVTHSDTRTRKNRRLHAKSSRGLGLRKQ